jgi:hypothetical protein
MNYVLKQNETKLMQCSFLFQIGTVSIYGQYAAAPAVRICCIVKMLEYG